MHIVAIRAPPAATRLELTGYVLNGAIVHKILSILLSVLRIRASWPLEDQSGTHGEVEAYLELICFHIQLKQLLDNCHKLCGQLAGLHSMPGNTVRKQKVR